MKSRSRKSRKSRSRKSRKSRSRKLRKSKYDPYSSSIPKYLMTGKYNVAFTSNIYRDKKKIGLIKNTGMGGSTYARIPSESERDRWQSWLKDNKYEEEDIVEKLIDIAEK